MCSDTTWSTPCCAAVSASTSVEGHLLAVGAPLSEQGNDGTEGRTEGGGAACVKRGSHSKKCYKQTTGNTHTNTQTGTI